MKILFAIAFLFGVSSYAAESAAGHYFTVGFSSERSLDLDADGSFQMTLQLTEGQKKETVERGTWQLADGVVSLRLAGDGDYDQSIWYARLFLRKKDGVRVLICAVKGDWAYDKYGFEEEPNQSLQPTAPSGRG